MRHAAVAAPGAVLAPAAVRACQAVAREYGEALQALVSLPGRRHRRHRSPGLAVARRQSAVRRQPVVAREIIDVYGNRQLGCRSRPYSRDSEQASVGLVAHAQGGYLGSGGLEIDRIVGNAPNARHRSSSMAYLRL